MVQLDIPLGAAGLVDALRWVRAYAQAEGLDERSAYTVSLVAEEILTNFVKHGSPRAPIRLRLSRDDGGVTLRFEDDGTPFDPSMPRDPSDPLREGGRGLALVQRHARSLDYRRSGDRNVFVVTV